MDSTNQVGWLVHAGYVIGLCCSPDKPTFTQDIVPIFDVNIKPYRQPCLYCGKELVENHCEVILFDNDFYLDMKPIFKERK